MATYLIRKLEQFVNLSVEDKRALEDLVTKRTRRIDARQNLILEGDRPSNVNLFLDGWASRYKTLEDGRRQTIGFLLPGDLCDLNILALRAFDYSIAALTQVHIAEIPLEEFRDITAHHMRITRALRLGTLVSMAIQREWLMSLGRRTAVERIGHLLCEVFLRLRAIGLTDNNTCEFPLTQADLGDATGLSTVHVNRSLQELRGMGLLQLAGRRLEIRDLNALQSAVFFNARYLNLDFDSSYLDSDWK